MAVSVRDSWHSSRCYCFSRFFKQTFFYFFFFWGPAVFLDFLTLVESPIFSVISTLLLLLRLRFRLPKPSLILSCRNGGDTCLLLADFLKCLYILQLLKNYQQVVWFEIIALMSHLLTFCWQSSWSLRVLFHLNLVSIFFHTWTADTSEPSECFCTVMYLHMNGQSGSCLLHLEITES